MIEFAIPHDNRIEQKEREEGNQNKDLKTELRKLWNMKVTVLPTVMVEI